MHWKDTGFLLSKNQFNENSVIAELFTENHGKVSGIIFGATSKKIRNYLQIGNKLHLNFNSKNDNKLSIVLGATNDLTNNFDSSQVIQDVSIILGGKGGGGRKDLAQAGGLSLDHINKAITKIKKNLEF